MRRNIWKELSPDILKRLEGEACQEYLRKLEEFNNVDSNNHIDEEKKLYDALEPEDKAAIDAEFENRSLNDDVEGYIHITANNSIPLRQVSDIQSELKFIAKMQYKYIYPEYSQLVGQPSDDDFYTDYQSNALTVERKADLLLLGVFEWKGLYITKAYHQNKDDPRGWLVCLEPDYLPTDILGVKYIGKQIDQMAFLPFNGLKSQWLHDYLFDCDVELGNRSPRNNNQYVTFRDSNPYNCLPGNLILAKKRGRGRPMLCGVCGKETTRENSMVISEKYKKTRYCLDCLRKMAQER